MPWSGTRGFDWSGVHTGGPQVGDGPSWRRLSCLRGDVADVNGRPDGASCRPSRPAAGRGGLPDRARTHWGWIEHHWKAPPGTWPRASTTQVCGPDTELSPATPIHW